MRRSGGTNKARGGGGGGGRGGGGVSSASDGARRQGTRAASLRFVSRLSALSYRISPVARSLLLQKHRRRHLRGGVLLLPTVAARRTSSVPPRRLFSDWAPGTFSCFHPFYWSDLRPQPSAPRLSARERGWGRGRGPGGRGFADLSALSSRGGRAAEASLRRRRAHSEVVASCLKTPNSSEESRRRPGRIDRRQSPCLISTRSFVAPVSARPVCEPPAFHPSSLLIVFPCFAPLCWPSSPGASDGAAWLWFCHGARQIASRLMDSFRWEAPSRFSLVIS